MVPGIARRRRALLVALVGTMPSCSLVVSTSGLSGGSSAGDAGVGIDASYPRDAQGAVDTSLPFDTSPPFDAPPDTALSMADSASAVEDAPSCVPITNGLVGHWPLTASTISGTTLVDTSGSGATGTLSGFSGSEPLAAPSPISSALVFPPTAQAYAAVDALALDTSAGGVNSVSMWFYRAGPNASVNDVLTLLPNSPRYDRWLTYGTQDAGPDTYLCFDTQHNDCWGIGATDLLDRWVHIVAEFVNGAITGDVLYVDGQKTTPACLTADGFQPCTYPRHDERRARLRPRARRIRGGRARRRDGLSVGGRALVEPLVPLIEMAWRG